jgi:hypothetical protein
MGVSANLPTIVALLLAMMAALVSGDMEEGQEIASFVAETLKCSNRRSWERPRIPYRNGHRDVCADGWTV